jgi:hypothetical protein
VAIHDFGIPFGVSVPAGRVVTDPSTFLSNNAPAFNTRDQTTTNIITGANDARAALLAANGNGPVILTPGTYRVAAPLTIDSGLWAPAAGAVLKPDAGVEITINGPLQSAGLYKIFDLSAGGRVKINNGCVEEMPVEWWGAGNLASVATNTAAYQAAILASLGMTSLADQSTGVRAPVTMSGLYSVDTVYLPRYAVVRGRSLFSGLQLTTANAKGFVLGRSALETDFLDNIQLSNLRIMGTPAVVGQGQQAIASALTAAAYITHLKFDNVLIQDVGGGGIDIVGAAASQMLYTTWKDVQIVNCASGYAYHVKLGIFNQAIYYDLNVSDNYDGIFFEDPGSGTMLAESHKFIGGNIEGNGKPDSGPNAGAYKIGARGFRSTCYQGQFDFHGTYIETNGNRPGDTTGANIEITNGVQVRVRGGILSASNNQIVMKNGGRARTDGVFIAPGANMVNIFKFDGAPPGTALSLFDDAGNDYDAGYTDAQKYTYANGATTRVIGYNDATNYLETPPRQKLNVFRDKSLPTISTGAIHVEGGRQLVNKLDNAAQIPVFTAGNNGIATICKATVNVTVVLTYYDGSAKATFLLAPGGLLQLCTDQRGAAFVAASATAGKLNVFYDAASNEFQLKNLTAGVANLSVWFELDEPMFTNADDGYYERQLLLIA